LNLNYEQAKKKSREISILLSNIEIFIAFFIFLLLLFRLWMVRKFFLCHNESTSLFRWNFSSNRSI